MPFTLYILYSKSIDQFYIGQTEDLADRLSRHRSGYSLSTKKARDWELFHQEVYTTRAEAMQREKYIKSRKSRKYIEELARSVGSCGKVTGSTPVFSTKPARTQLAGFFVSLQAIKQDLLS